MAEMDRSYGIAMSPGSTVVIYLHSPREKLWGVLDEITLSGVYLRGIDLNTFDEWIRMIVRGEGGISLSYVFLPMWRVERVSLDETVDEIPSLAETFYSRVGLTIKEYLASR